MYVPFGLGPSTFRDRRSRVVRRRGDFSVIRMGESDSSFQMTAGPARSVTFGGSTRER